MIGKTVLIPMKAEKDRKTNQIAIAQKALLLVEGLSSADKRVAGAIIDHFNRTTGQCDPSVGRLALLLDIDETTVKRATRQLCEKKLFKKRSHGGKAGRASYTPNWEEFRRLVIDWDRRMKTVSGPDNSSSNGAEMPPDTGQNCPVDGGENAPQTNLSNQSKEPIPERPVPDSAKFGLSEDPEKELWKRVDEAKSSANYEARERATTGSSRAENAWSAAHRRVDAAILQLHPQTKEAVWTWLDEASLNEAIREEMSRRGGGMRFILAGLQRERLKPIEVPHSQLH